jgi:hypothetical protein
MQIPTREKARFAEQSLRKAQLRLKVENWSFTAGRSLRHLPPIDGSN